MQPAPETRAVGCLAGTAWSVDEFRINGTDRPPLFTAPLRWKPIVFDWAVPYKKSNMISHFGPGTRRLFSMDFDATSKSMALLQPEPLAGGRFRVRIGSGVLVPLGARRLRISRIIITADVAGRQ